MLRSNRACFKSLSEEDSEEDIWIRGALLIVYKNEIVIYIYLDVIYNYLRFFKKWQLRFSVFLYANNKSIFIMAKIGTAHTILCTLLLEIDISLTILREA